MKIACLHTAASNIAIFDHAAAELAETPVILNHLVMPDLLAEAESSGGMTAEQRRRLALFLQSLRPFFDVILITCSTLGAVAEDFAADDGPCRVCRTDKMLADALAHRPGKSVVLYAAPSTLAATTALFCSGITPSDAPDIVLVNNAWRAFKAGDAETYQQLIVNAIAAAYARGADNVALAQVSMSPAAHPFSQAQKPLTAPRLALQYCLSVQAAVHK